MSFSASRASSSHRLSCVHLFSMSVVQLLTDAPLVALARHAASTLTALDVSMSRGVTDAGLGCVADACTALRTLTVWGCTQLTGLFFNGHKRAIAAAVAAALDARRAARADELVSTPNRGSGGAASHHGGRANGHALGSKRKRLEDAGGFEAAMTDDSVNTGRAASASPAAHANDANPGLDGAAAAAIADAAYMAPLRVYGRPGDLLCAAD